MADPELWKSLMSAVETSDLPQLTSLLAQHPSPATINHADRLGRTLLHVAAYRDNGAIVQALVDAGANVDAVDNTGCAPIHTAAIRAYLNVARVLIRAGANINVVINGGYNAPLKIAMDGRFHDIARLLADAGACIDPEYEAEHANELRLWTAVLRGDLDELRRRINAGDSVDQAPQGGKAKGWTALWLAMRLGRDDAARMLIQAGADVNAVGDNNYTLLHLALDNDQFDLAKLLVEANADVNAAERFGRVPLYIASVKGNLDMVRVLIEAGANVDATDKHGDTPYIRASANGHIAVAKLLIESGANVYSTDSRGKTSLHKASSSGDLEVVKLLVEAGVNVNAVDNDRETPLHDAISHDPHLELAKFLIDAGANINAQDRFRRTPLYYTALNGYFEVAKLLIDHGADYQLPDWKGVPPLQVLLSTMSNLITPTSFRETFTLLTDAGATVDGATATISPLVPSDVIRAIVPEDTHFWLAANNDAPMLAAELASGLDPNTKTANGMTLLHWACAGEAPECVQLLLEAGADKRAGDPKPIFYCMHESSVCLKHMIEHGADVNRSSEFNYETKYPIHLALAANSPACVTALVGAGAWVTEKEMGEDHILTPLQVARYLRPVPVDALRALLAAAGERVLSERIRGMPILHWTIMYSNLDNVRVLVEGGADVNEKYSGFNDALEVAEYYLTHLTNSSDASRLTPIVDYLKSLPCFSEEQ